MCNLKALYDKAASYKDFLETDFIFNKHRPIPNTTLTRVFKRHLKLAGLKDMHIHNFRHSSISALYDTCNDVVSVAKLVGHASPDMCTRYIHPNEKIFVKLVMH